MIKRRKRRTHEIPTSSMADIAFLLLVFFLVTTSFSNEKGIFITLPENADNSQQSVTKINPKNVTQILVSAEGKVAINYMHETTNVDLKRLTDIIKKQIAIAPKKMIISVKVDADAQYQSMVSVMDKVNQSKAPRVMIVTNE